MLMISATPWWHEKFLAYRYRSQAIWNIVRSRMSLPETWVRFLTISTGCLAESPLIAVALTVSFPFCSSPKAQVPSTVWS
jgi:hypothetical protein